MQYSLCLYVALVSGFGAIKLSEKDLPFVDDNLGAVLPVALDVGDSQQASRNIRDWCSSHVLGVDREISIP